MRTFRLIFPMALIVLSFCSKAGERGGAAPTVRDSAGIAIVEGRFDLGQPEARGFQQRRQVRAEDAERDGRPPLRSINALSMTLKVSSAANTWSRMT